MTGEDAEDGKRSAMVAIDFATGRVVARFPAAGKGIKHLLGDFIIAEDGTIYATDSTYQAIWRLPPDGKELEVWLENKEFMNLQGLAFSADGQTLYLSDYANGIWRIDVAKKDLALLTAPANATFFGIDGIYAVPGGLLAVQNGVNPQRVLRIEPATEGASATRVVATGQPDMTDLSLGHVSSDRFYFVGNSGWSLFDPPTENPPAARRVTIYSINLD
jgi:streptogramin lyase